MVSELYVFILAPIKVSFIDDPSPFSKLRGSDAAPKQAINVQAPRPAVRVNTGTISTVPPSRPRAVTISQVKQSTPSTLKRGNAARGGPIPSARPEKTSRVLPARPATAAGRVSSTLRTAPAPMTSRVPARPATSASLRPPARGKNPTRQTANVRADETVPPAKSEFTLEFDCIMEDGAEDFMFDV